MEILSSADTFVLQVGALGGLAYATRSLVSRYTQQNIPQPNLPLLTAAKNGRPSTVQPTRSIIKQLDQNGKPCMVFYGSQTGTAERFAHRFAREALARYAMGCVVADLDDYDFGDLLKLSRKHLIVLVLATYGEGEPTDNAISFQKFIDTDNSQVNPQSLHYSAFGLGSSSYTQYNAMVRRVDDTLTKCGACRVGPLGMGDDGKGTLEEDFTVWVDATLPLAATHFGLPDIPLVYRPAFEVTEQLSNKSIVNHIFLGEPNKAHLHNRIQGPYTAQNPFPASITQSRELFSTKERSCLHLEFDISGTSISYDTGDHLAVWPINSDLQVNLFLQVFGLNSKRHVAIDVVPADVNNKSPIPGRTTYETVIRHYLDICATTTRQTLRQLSDFATSEDVRTKLLKLSNDTNYFASTVTARQLTVSQLLQQLCAGTEASLGVIDAPFSLILELIPKLKPRHYSISSSSLNSRKSISITAVIDSKEDPANQISFRGVSTSYLSALKNAYDESSSSIPTHTFTPSRHSSRMEAKPNPRALIHVRRSKFRPPFDPSIPIVMIGPGTGIAPFRAFIHERATQKSQGRTIGRTILFYGCRSSSQDFLYKNEWQDLLDNERLGGGVFSMYTAFSREPGKPKKYAQDLLKEDGERAEELRWLVSEMGARVYVCGDASRMARDVARVMGEVLVGDGDGNGTDIVAQLKKEGRWCEDVW